MGGVEAGDILNSPTACGQAAPIMRRITLLAVIGALCWVGCDAFGGDNGVRGHVVDSATGEPVSPGSVFVRVYGHGLSLFPPLLASGYAGTDGAFSFSELEESPHRVFFGASARIDYPGRDSTALLAHFDGFRKAYFGLSVPARSDLGTVEMHPTCTTFGDIQLSRPLSEGESVYLRLASVPDVGGRFASETVKGGGESLDSLRLLSVGGREARLEWSVRRGQQEPDIASGVVLLPLCPRHGVLEYAATLDIQ